MALQRSSLTSLGRLTSRQWMVRSFIATLGGRTDTHPRTAFKSERPFSNAAVCRNDASNTNAGRGSIPVNEMNDARLSKSDHTAASTRNEADAEVEEATEETSPRSESYIPWYLQSQHQPSSRSPAFLEEVGRQQIPDLPIHPPPLLQPLLEQVSIDLGMDDLTLLDLRALDPPPALGANLLMIIGTARSEKHLHVSADRLCRWLRSTYGLRPFADGLLGRNELKLKLRRRAKRSKLMSSVGAKSTADTELEDGLRTGWVCVNVGRVEGGELPEDQKKVQRREGMVGFGAAFEGCNVVVQMLTGEKREEVNLEKLWDGIMSRAEIDNMKEDDLIAQAEAEAEADSFEAGGLEGEGSERSSYQPMGAGGNTDRPEARI